MGGGFFFRWEGFIFKWEASVLVGGFSKKIIRGGGAPPPFPPTMGNPAVFVCACAYVCVCACVCVWFVRKNSLTQRRGALNVNK